MSYLNIPVNWKKCFVKGATTRAPLEIFENWFLNRKYDDVVLVVMHKQNRLHGHWNNKPLSSLDTWWLGSPRESLDAGTRLHLEGPGVCLKLVSFWRDLAFWAKPPRRTRGPNLHLRQSTWTLDVNKRVGAGHIWPRLWPDHHWASGLLQNRHLQPLDFHWSWRTLKFCSLLLIQSDPWWLRSSSFLFSSNYVSILVIYLIMSLGGLEE